MLGRLCSPHEVCAEHAPRIALPDGDAAANFSAAATRANDTTGRQSRGSTAEGLRKLSAAATGGLALTGFRTARELPSRIGRDDSATLIRAVIDTARRFNARHQEASPAVQPPRIAEARATGPVARSASSTARLK
jgi:hypothetical protein